VAAAPGGQHEASQLVDDGEIRAGRTGQSPARQLGSAVDDHHRGVTVVALHVIETTGERQTHRAGADEFQARPTSELT